MRIILPLVDSVHYLVIIYSLSCRYLVISDSVHYLILFIIFILSIFCHYSIIWLCSLFCHCLVILCVWSRSGHFLLMVLPFSCHFWFCLFCCHYLILSFYCHYLVIIFSLYVFEFLVILILFIIWSSSGHYCVAIFALLHVNMSCKSVNFISNYVY